MNLGPSRGSVKAAVIGPGNIGSDLLIKLLQVPVIDVCLMAGLDHDSRGLARAAELGIETSAEGVDAVLAREDIRLVFDATAAQAHVAHAPRLKVAGKRVIDLTPAAVGCICGAVGQPRRASRYGQREHG
jgi:acetaldehyde dehydrogenase